MRDEGGDPACWAARVCDVCGEVVRDGAVHTCARVVGLDQLGADGGADGVVWSLGGARQLDVNLVVLGPNGGIGEHRNDALDVCVVVLEGGGALVLDGTPHALAARTLAFVPRGARRAIAAGPQGLRYLTCHVAGPGPTVRPA